MSTTDRTVAFLDLTRFTTLTDVHGDQKAAEVIDQFLNAVTAEIGGRGRVVKTLGDGVLLELVNPGASIGIADRISHRLHERSGLPELTGGICTGPVVDRGDDILGSTVNLAARLAELAPAGELRVTEPPARAAADAGWSVEPLGPIEIRGFQDPVDLYSVLLCHPSDCVTDPVCGMRLTAGDDTPTVQYDGEMSWFCSASCRDRFNATPARYDTTAP
ncbi:MAG: YHS domain-containing protein [Acidimicrobiales bacterium]|nr:YHS domain-containing protein [Acidimicrobiales bacterium]